MKTRHSLVSNSSSTSFIIDSKVDDPELKSNLWSILNEYAIHIEPENDDPTMFYISTGQSQGNKCLMDWWRLKKWFVDHNIKHEETGDGTPNLEQRACDFVCYVTEDEELDKTDPRAVSELKEWLNSDAPNKRLDREAQSIGITKDEIKNAKFNLDIIQQVMETVE